MEKTTFLTRIIPNSLIGRISLFFSLPAILLLMTLWAALFQPTPLAPYLCGLLLFGSVMSAKYRTKGLILSIGSLLGIFFFLHTDLLIWEIGLCLVATFDFVIVMLAAAEIKTSLATLVDESKCRMNQYLAKNQELLTAEEKWAKTKQTLEEEIAQWKEEAKQRKIDLVAAEEKMQLIQSEIEMLTAQKENILGESYAMRKEAAQQLTVLKEQMMEVERAREEVHRRLETTVDEAALNARHEQHIAALKEEYEALLQQKPTHTDALYKQLRTQFDEKARVLIQTRKELFQTQTKLQSLQLEEELAQFEGPSEELRNIETELNRVVLELQALEEEVSSLEALISHILAQ